MMIGDEAHFRPCSVCQEPADMEAEKDAVGRTATGEPVHVSCAGWAQMWPCADCGEWQEADADRHMIRPTPSATDDAPACEGCWESAAEAAR